MIEFLGTLNEVFNYLSGQAVWWGLMLLMLSAMIEYIFPIFPGDTVTLAGAVLIPQAGWPIWGVFGAVMVGTAFGAALDWRLGMWLAHNESGDTWLHRWLQREHVAEKVEKLDRQFQKWGSLYITLNRFVPAFRAVFFIAAGMSKLNLWKVLFFGMISAAIWNGVILSVGYMVGYKLERLAYVFHSYSRIFLVVLGLIAVGWLFKIGWSLLRASRS